MANGTGLRRKIYTLWDCYLNSDVVLYPTKIEGFGNQLVEAIFFEKPVVLTPYPVYTKDIRSLGLDVIEMPGWVTNEAIAKVRELIGNKDLQTRAVEKNFKIGTKHFSYEAVGKQIVKLFSDLQV